MVLLSARMDQSSMHQKLDPMQNEIVQYFPLFFLEYAGELRIFVLRRRKRSKYKRNHSPVWTRFSPFGRFNDITALQADSFSIKILMLASFCFQ